MIRKTLNRWEQFWFSYTSHPGFGFLRIILIAFFAYQRFEGGLYAVAPSSDLPQEFMAPSLGLRLIPLPYPLPADVSFLLAVCLRTAGLCALLGLWTRPMLFIFSLGFLYLNGARNSWGFFAHTPALPALVLLILSLAPGCDQFSLDRIFVWLKAKRQGKTLSFWKVFWGNPVSGWGLRLILVLLSLLYFSAGVSKLRYSGIQWADGATLAFYMKGKSTASLQQFSGPVSPPREARWKDGFGLENYLYATSGSRHSRFLAKSGPLMTALSLFTLLMELAFPLVLLGGWLKVLLLLAAALFHWGTFETLNIYFQPYAWICLVLMDWHLVLKK